MNEIKLKVLSAPGPFMATVSLQTGEGKVREATEFAPKGPTIGIVKVQVPLAGPRNTPAMVYNRDRSFETFAEVTSELRAALPDFKGYFRCRIDAGEIVLIARMGAQPW